VGSSKSTICRLLKRGLEQYSATPEGAWYSYKWINLPCEGTDALYTGPENNSPLNEDPIKLMPIAMRQEFLKELNENLAEMTNDEGRADLYQIKSEGELNSRCKFFMRSLLKKYDGDWEKVVSEHIRVVRKIHSEIDRVGIGTFQPKDEKNQDATELTGDMDFGKIGHFGADSDPRAFNFDGEFPIANRGLFECIEILKLDNAFLYDFLGATQEHQIKPKKFSQVMIDEVIIGHSVHGDTPIPHLYDGILDVLPIQDLVNLEVGKLQVFSVNLETNEVELTPVKNVFSHDYEGEWVKNNQDGDSLTTTPNHSVYKNTEAGYETFYPGEDENTEIARIKLPVNVVVNYPKTDRWNEFFKEK
jgi:serine protein kinase